MTLCENLGINPKIPELKEGARIETSRYNMHICPNRTRDQVESNSFSFVTTQSASKVHDYNYTEVEKSIGATLAKRRWWRFSNNNCMFVETAP
jgi:hypothetical protein